FVLGYPENARIEPILKMASLRNKASLERREALEAIETHCMERILGEAQAASLAGELPGPADTVVQPLVLGLWSLHVGFNVLHNLESSCCGPLPPGTPRHPHAAMFPVAQRLLDGYGWRPLSHEFDYSSLRTKLIRERFFAEAGALLES
ncbi:MAG TPA: hypothetical protein PLJ12_10530, partial [Planctomycetota bacterium]|nr:hypothetical protein [Planctomycetota bacterium]